MITLSSLANTYRPKLKIQRVGRGAGSKRGKTCGRGSKGDKARCGYRQRYGEEGGQKPLYKRLPCRGFTNARFKKTMFSMNFSLIDQVFSDGETVSAATLMQKGYIGKNSPVGLKVISGGELNKKKLHIEATGFSASAKEYLEKHKISHKLTTE